MYHFALRLLVCAPGFLALARRLPLLRGDWLGGLSLGDGHQPLDCLVGQQTAAHRLLPSVGHEGRTHLVRPDPKDPDKATILPVRLDHIVLEGNYETNYQIEPGDRVWVPPHYLAVVAYWIDNILWPFRTSINTVAPISSN